MHHKGLTQRTFKFAQKIPNRLTLTATDPGRATHMPKWRRLLAFQVSQGLLPSLQLPLQKGADVHRVPNHICQVWADTLDASQLLWCTDYSPGLLMVLMRKQDCAGAFKSRWWCALAVRRVTAQPWLTHDTLIKTARGSEKSSLSIIFVETRMMLGCWMPGENINLGLFSNHNTLPLSQGLQAR